MSRTAQEKEWGREKDNLRKAESIEHYKSFLVDMVRNADANWYEAKRLLRDDNRWEMFDMLDIDEKESLFREHVSNLGEKKRLWFRKLLEETSQVGVAVERSRCRVISHAEFHTHTHTHRSP